MATTNNKPRNQLNLNFARSKFNLEKPIPTSSTIRASLLQREYKYKSSASHFGPVRVADEQIPVPAALAQAQAFLLPGQPPASGLAKPDPNPAPLQVLIFSGNLSGLRSFSGLFLRGRLLFHLSSLCFLPLIPLLIRTFEVSILVFLKFVLVLRLYYACFALQTPSLLFPSL